MAYLTNVLGRASFIALLLLGCGGNQDASTSSTRSVAVPAAMQTKPTAVAPLSWFADERVVDFTGDAQPDTARLEAIGPTVDSSQIVFTIRSGGNTVYRNTWSSAYALSAISGEGSLAVSSPDSALRTQLRAFMSKLKIESLDRKELRQSWLNKTDDCSEDPRNCLALQLLDDSTKKAGFSTGRSLIPLFDTATVNEIVADMLAHPVPVLSYTYGTESQAKIAWSPAKQRFFTLYECC